METSYYRKARDKSKIHNKFMVDAKTKNNILSILNIVLVSFAGISNYFVSTDYNYLVSIVLYLSLFVSGVHKYFNYEEAIEKHRVSSILYSTLSQNIQDGSIPHQYIISQLQLLKVMEPDVPELFEDGPENSETTHTVERAPHIEPEPQTDAEFDFEMKRFMNI